MRIIANNYDYYDGVQRHGQDRSLIYHRTEKTFDDRTQHTWLQKYHDQMPFGGVPKIIGFCGQIYVCVQFTHAEYVGRMHNVEHFTCYTIDEVDAYVAKHKDKKQRKDYYEARQPYRKWNKPDRFQFQQFFETAHKDCIELFSKFACPIFLIEDYRITVNPELKRVDFFRVVDPYSAFQELERYLGNIAQPEKIMPVIPDELKAESKGFDKFSFRKQKS